MKVSMATTHGPFPCGEVSKEAQALMDVTRESLFEGINAARPGNRLGDIGSAVQGMSRRAATRWYAILSATE